MDPSPEPPYFAYGSNLSLDRFRQRVPSASVLGIGYVPGRTLRFHKIGTDGSGKADAAVTDDDADRVWGVLYAFDPAHRRGLDRVEGAGLGYHPQPVVVVRPDGARTDAWLYEADPRHCDEHLTPWDWYLRLCVVGAREHGLPTEYVARLGLQISRPDPDRARAARNLGIREG